MGKSKTIPREQEHLFDSTHFYEPGEEPWQGLAVVDPRELEEFRKRLDQYERISVDFETDGEHKRKCKIVGINVGWGDEDEHRYLPVRTMPMDPRLSWEDDVVPFLRKLVADGKVLVIHNSPFDLPIWTSHGLPEPVDFDDTMIMAHTSDPHRRKGLKYLSSNMLEMTQESYAKTVKGNGDLSQVPLAEAAKYGTDDTKACYGLYPILKRDLEEKGLYGHYLTAKRQVKLVDWVESGGMPIDRDCLLTQKADAEQYLKVTVSEATERIRKLAVERKALMDAGRLVHKDSEGGEFILRWPKDLDPERLTCVAGKGEGDLITSLDGLYGEYENPWDVPLERVNKKKARALGKDPHELNLRSTEQMKEFLFGTLRLPLEQWEDIDEGINKSCLIRLRKDGFDFADTLLRFSKVNKLLSAFFVPIVERLEQRDGWWWLYANFNPFGTVTGRWASSGPNLQNIPNAVKKLLWSMVRQSFAAPPGWKIIAADLSQIELRLLCHFSRDPNMKRIYDENGDIHAMTGARLAQVAYEEFTTWAPPEDLNADLFTEQQQTYTMFRKQAKPFNFGVSYRMGPKKFRNYAADAYDVWLTHEQAQSGIDAFFELYQGITGYHQNVLKRVAHVGNVPTLFGRRAYFDAALAKVVLSGNRRDSNFYRGDENWRKAVNFPIQGSAADLIVKAMFHMMDEWFGSQVRIISQVHDEVLLLAPDHLADAVAAKAREFMEGTAPNLFVPVKSSVKVAQNWLSAH